LYAVSCRFPAWLKQAKFTGALSAAISLAAFGAVQAKAAIVATTITGHVYSGTDSTGILGFPPGTNLKGKAYTLTFYFDDTQGTQSTSGSCPPTPCGSSINNSALAGEPWPPPATAVLQVAGGAPWIFGELGASSVLSTVQRNTGSLGSSIGLALEENYAAGGGQDGLNGVVTPASGTVLTTDYNWEDALYNNNLGPTQISFAIEPVYGGVAQNANGYLNLSTITVSGPIANPPGQGNGNCAICNATRSEATASQLAAGLAITSSDGNRAGEFVGGDPITLGTGNLFEQATDYTTAGQNPLSLIRYYNSAFVNPASYAVTLGGKWRSNYDRYLHIVTTPSATGYVTAERPDGQQITFTSSGTAWVTDSDVDYTLTNSGTTWTLTDPDDTVETYTAPGVEGRLSTIVARNGYTQSLSYTTGLLLHTVTDSYSRVLTFKYAGTGTLLTNVVTPDSATGITYGFTSGMLTTVTYPTSPTTTLTYLYENLSLPTALTCITDENGHRYATWAYDTTGRATSSLLGDTLNANQTKITYPTSTTATVTNAFGVVDTYTFSTIQGIPKVSGISRAATSNTAAATRSFGYDSNGYLNSATDWNGNQTTYVNNAHGDPLTINEAVNSPAVARTTTIVYDSVFVHLPGTITTAGLTTGFTYDGGGNPKTRTDTDTTTNTVPYSTNGQTRVTQYMWTSTGQEKSVQLPRTDVTAKTVFGYDGTGALTSITDALSHETQITAHTGGGLPLTVIDPNNVTTTLTYDGRLNLNTSTLYTTAGNLLTTWTHDPATNLIAVQQPDNSKLTYGYDAAHRITDVTDLFGNNLHYTLDQLGDVTLAEVKNPSGTMTWQHSGMFDAVGRVLKDIGGMGQTTAYTWDPMSDVLTVTPPAPSGTVTQTWDALNRLSTSTDPAPGGTTTYGYDAHDRMTSVTDANGNTTAYVYNGFGDRTQTASPDSGTTVYYYDPDRNLTQRVMPGNLTMNATFDAFDRNLTVKYTDDATLSVTDTYDQSGHGFGIGRLTSATDQVGSLSLTYDERGNVTAESRTPSGLTALNTSYGYDAASNIASITYPSTTFVQYARDIMGRVSSVTAKLPGASSASNVVTGVTYRPLPEFEWTGSGQVSGLTFGNGIKGAYGYDLDYRPTTRKDNGTAAVQNLTYGYYANNSVKTITDAVNAANSQSMTYDPLDRLKTAASGTGGYGTFGFTWDPVSNVKTQTINGTRTTYTYKSGTNRLTAITTVGATQTVGSTPAGNIATFKTGSTAVETLTYNKANQLASATTATQTATYAYDLLGRRIEKVGTATATTVFQYDQNNNLLEERDGSGTTRADYVYLNPQSGPGAPPIGTVQPSSNAVYFLHTDRLGTPTVATDNNKVVQWSATYQPFGYTATGTSAIVQNLRLPGQEWDLESTFNHNGARTYAPLIGRYVQTDPIGLNGGANTYAYANSNPFRFTDRSGLDTMHWWNTTGGRSPIQDGPTYGNWGGGCWSGGGYSCGGNPWGDFLPPIDSSDQAYMAHDMCYTNCSAAPNQCFADSNGCKAQCDSNLVTNLNALPPNPYLWPIPPTSDNWLAMLSAAGYKQFAIWFFRFGKGVSDPLLSF
jgi:RHS repeat-associated protein